MRVPSEGVTRQVGEATLRKFLEGQFKNNELADILKDLASNEFGSNEEFDAVIDRLKALYMTPEGGRSDFRHDYSTIARVMCELAAPAGVQEFNGTVDMQDYFSTTANRLADRLNFLTIAVMDRDDLSGMQAPMKKLRDHVNLEIVRINYVVVLTTTQDGSLGEIGAKVAESQAKSEEIYNQVKTAKDDVANLKSSVDISQGRIMDAEKAIEESKKSYTAVLGILAAVVLAFNGAVTFAASTVSAVAGYHPFSIGFVVVLVGFVLFNCLVAVFTFLRMTVREDKPWEKWHAYVFLGIDAVLLLVLLFMFFVIKDAYWL